MEKQSRGAEVSRGNRKEKWRAGDKFIETPQSSWSSEGRGSVVQKSSRIRHRRKGGPSSGDRVTEVWGFGGVLWQRMRLRVSRDRAQRQWSR